MTPRILIVGAGIGGLTLAQCLKRRKIDFDLVERAPENGPVGAGISLTINAMRLLEALGLADGLRERGYSYSDGWLRNDRDDALQHLDLRPLRSYGEALALHRADLHAVLRQGLTPQYGTEVTRLQVRGNQVQASFQDNQGEYDLVVAADGLNSTVRQQLAPNVKPVYNGYTSWRYTQPDPIGLTEPVEYWGAGRRIGLVPIGSGRLYVFATFNSPPLVERPGFPWPLFSSFPPLVEQVRQAMPLETKVIQTDIRELKSHVWNRPQVAFLGDAAHGLTPNLGQGAGMSIEDAVVLAECLHQHGTTEQALTLYEQVRRERMQTVAQQSRLLGHLGQLEAPTLRRLRDWIFTKTPTSAAERNTWQVMIRDAPQPPRY